MKEESVERQIEITSLREAEELAREAGKILAEVHYYIGSRESVRSFGAAHEASGDKTKSPSAYHRLRAHGRLEMGSLSLSDAATTFADELSSYRRSHD